MKKHTLIALFSLCFIAPNYAQEEMGFRTFDVGVEYKYVQNSPGINLQIAINAKTHHSFVASIGYKSAWKPIPETHNNEKGNGWGGSLGYRYYFGVMPKRFFLGIRGEAWSMGLYRTANAADPNTNVLIVQPQGEIGYTLIINDIVFVTPFFSMGKQVTVSSPGDTFLYGHDMVKTFGLSAGWRF